MPRIINLGEYHQTLENVYLIFGEGLCSNIYVIGRAKATLIDTGVGTRSNPVWPQLGEIGVEPNNVENIIITHAHHDHAMGTFIILQRSNPKVYIHEKDTRHIASRLGDNLVKVREGDVIETEKWPLTVYWTPGHTEGGICLYNLDYKILFSGDTVFPGGSFGRFDGESGSYKRLIKSLKKLRELDLELLLPGHGSPIFGGANEHIERAYYNAVHWI
jgi:glyoxylase-like metal-dependent hydrolase (beta-lactamase superfamily II)